MGNLEQAIKDGMRRAWVEDPIGLRCFDYDEARMSLLLGFIDKTIGTDEFEDVRQHLIDCQRCRFIYVVTRYPNKRT